MKSQNGSSVCWGAITGFQLARLHCWGAITGLQLARLHCWGPITGAPLLWIHRWGGARRGVQFGGVKVPTGDWGRGGPGLLFVTKGYTNKKDKVKKAESHRGFFPRSDSQETRDTDLPSRMVSPS